MSAHERTQRRLAAIVAADIAGFSRLISEDEEGTLAALKAHRVELIDPLLAKYDGRIANTAGDSLLLEFPSAVEAMRCTIAVQMGMTARNMDVASVRRIRFRIGINVGDVIAEGEDLLGDGVNVAARLEGLADPGGICISRMVRDNVRDRMEIELEDMGEIEVKNIARLVHAFKVITDDGRPTSRPTVNPSSRPLLWLTAFAALILICGGAVSYWWLLQRDLTGKDATERVVLPSHKPSIAILPFANLSDDKEQEYFADGMTDDLITDLSKISGLIVIARNSVFTYKGKNVKVQEIAKDLGVTHVLEGSIRRAGSRVRINAQLIDTKTGDHLWAERYDGKLDDVFKLQDSVTAQITQSLALSLFDVESKSLVRHDTDDIAAYDAFLKGREHFLTESIESFARAIPYLEEAVRLDTNYNRAHALLAVLYERAAEQRWAIQLGYTSSDFLEERSKQHLDLALRTAEPRALLLEAKKLRYAFEHDHALKKARQAVKQVPNNPEIRRGLALELVFAGQPEQALPEIDKAIELDPLNQWHVMEALALAKLGLDQPAEAVDALKKALIQNPKWAELWFLLIAALGLTDQLDEAKAAIEKLDQIKRDNIWPKQFYTSSFTSWYGFRREEDVKRINKGHRLAGLK